jgi:hypothetical protein
MGEEQQGVPKMCHGWDLNSSTVIPTLSDSRSTNKAYPTNKVNVQLHEPTTSASGSILTQDRNPATNQGRLCATILEQSKNSISGIGAPFLDDSYHTVSSAQISDTWSLDVNVGTDPTRVGQFLQLQAFQRSQAAHAAVTATSGNQEVYDSAGRVHDMGVLQEQQGGQQGQFEAEPSVPTADDPSLLQVGSTSGHENCQVHGVPSAQREADWNRFLQGHHAYQAYLRELEQHGQTVPIEAVDTVSGDQVSCLWSSKWRSTSRTYGHSHAL